MCLTPLCRPQRDGLPTCDSHTCSDSVPAVGLSLATVSLRPEANQAGTYQSPSLPPRQFWIQRELSHGCCHCESTTLQRHIGLCLCTEVPPQSGCVCSDEFSLALDAWKDGTVDGWSTLSTGSWNYAINSTCFPATPSKPLAPQAMAENLGAEADERSTFLPYTPIVFADGAPEAVGGSSGQGCQLAYNLTGPANMLVRFCHACFTALPAGLLLFRGSSLRCSTQFIHHVSGARRFAAALMSSSKPGHSRQVRRIQYCASMPYAWEEWSKMIFHCD